MARNRFENLEPEKQEVILRAAGEEFATRGFEAASINRIIERSGMSKGSVYYYFDDKADLFSTVIERSTQRMMEEIGWFSLEILGPEEFWDSILLLTRRSVDFVRSDDWWVRLARSLHHLGRNPQEAAAIRRITDFARDLWRGIIQRGQAIGVVRTDMPLGLLVAITLGADFGGDQWMMEHWDDFSQDELAKIVDARVDLLRDMLDKENEGWER
jgi:AcrR family transcriptional regulator